MDKAIKRFKKRISEGKLNLGTVVSLSDPSISELVASIGYDFLWIDMEHAPITIETVLHHIMALGSTETAALVRVPYNNQDVIKTILDMAPGGIIVPNVKTADEAATVVKACKYPPAGNRGFGPRRGIGYGTISVDEYLKEVDETLMVFIQIEHIDAVKNLDEILSVPGLDGIMLGPNDLSGSMGMLGKSSDPEVVAVMEKVIKKAKDKGLIVGMVTGNDSAVVKKWVDNGVDWLTMEGDWSALFNRMKDSLDNVRKIGC